MRKNYCYRHPPWQHQAQAIKRSWDKVNYALFMEQGTGKTKVIIDNAGLLYLDRKIELLAIVAPDGVQRAWVRDELPKHISPDVPYRAAWWENRPSKKLAAKLEALWDRSFIGLRVLAVNYETLATAAGKKGVRKYLEAFNCMLVCDESHKVKNIKARRSKVCVDLSPLAEYRRILTGTPVANSPLDAFGQFLFLDEDILGIHSFVAFKAHYAEIEPSDSPLLRHIMQRLIAKYAYAAAQQKRPKLIRRDPETGQPIFRNLDELQEKIARHSYRVLKKDCLDLPEKVYSKRYVTLTSEQRRIYQDIKEDFIAEYEGKVMATPMAITRLMRLSQVTGGFFKRDAQTDEVLIDGGNPKLDSLLDGLAETQGKALIWARFVSELNLIANTIEEEYGEGSVARYWGEQGKGARDRDKKRFETDPACRWFVSQPGAGGTGLDGLQVAGTEFYFSNEFSLTIRLQSEDRAHRGGSEIHDRVTIIDIEAEDTLDGKIIEALRSKKDISDLITGDDPREWI